jgi:hypothetical protein
MEEPVLSLKERNVTPMFVRDTLQIHVLLAFIVMLDPIEKDNVQEKKYIVTKITDL